MTSYIILICLYSFYHFCLLQVKNTINMHRPMYLMGRFGEEDFKINTQFVVVRIPVFISFIIALFVFDYLQVLLNTLLLRVGIFFLLVLIKPLLHISIKKIGIIIYITKWITLLCVIYFILFEFIIKLKW